jgi:hypothetical protein
MHDDELNYLYQKIITNFIKDFLEADEKYLWKIHLKKKTGL